QALALAEAGGVGGAADEELQPKGGAGRAAQRAADRGAEEGAADARQGGEVLEVVGPAVEILGVIGSDAARVEVDAQAAVGADRIALDAVPGAEEAGNGDPSAGVEGDGVAHAGGGAPDGAAVAADHGHAGAAVAQVGRAADVGADPVALHQDNVAAGDLD